MTDLDKLAFKDMIVAVFAIYNKPPPEKEMLRIWFHKLSRFDFSVVAKALDVWTDTPNKLPQPADIIALCKPREDVYFALPSPVNYAENKKHIEELNTFVAKKLKPKTDHKAWAKRIIANPQNFPEISLKYAQEAMQHEMA
jgi:hypothetical protein